MSLYHFSKMGRRGKTWRQIHAFRVQIGDKIVMIDLDSEEKIQNKNDSDQSLKQMKKIIRKDQNSLEKIPLQSSESASSNDSETEYCSDSSCEFSDSNELFENFESNDSSFEFVDEQPEEQVVPFYVEFDDIDTIFPDFEPEWAIEFDEFAM
ncbi:hypothetical protein TRFO_36284 [Tritrichomonas foetus]|uniref:Uncharacterized protein n=1 Tax=Tritrichomonas foetus TaxID=1144522 RepID=A0A1J4JEF7_9EUKA|nr:hypothetical protein TRFO_36284 [Tritrichomonas foetus]|eukprot:OHS97496.1 hypothetical protein TRFO_36284 [Tritrichomonas foetus]